MERSFKIVDGRPQIICGAVSTGERAAIEHAIEKFRCSTNHAVGGFADMLLSDFRIGVLSTQSIERLSKWANSDGTFASAVDPAREVVSLLVGCSLDRLIDEKGVRMDDYAERVTDLDRRLSIASIH